MLWRLWLNELQLHIWKVDNTKCFTFLSARRWTVTAEGAADRAQKPQLLHDIFDFMPRGWLRCDRTLGRIIWLGINLDSFPPQIIFCWISWPHYPFRVNSFAKAWAFVFTECSDLCLILFSSVFLTKFTDAENCSAQKQKFLPILLITHCREICVRNNRPRSQREGKE